MASQGVHYGQGGLDEKVEFRAWDCDMGCGDAKQRITAERHSYSRKHAFSVHLYIDRQVWGESTVLQG